MSKFPRCRNVNVPKRPRRRNVRSRNEPKLLSLAFSRHFFLKFFKLMMRAARHHVLLCLFSFYFRLVTFFRNFSKTKVLSIRYRQFCSVKSKLKFSQQIADPRSMFCFSECSFWNCEPLAFRISGYSVGNPSSDWKFQCEISKISFFLIVFFAK